VGFDAWFAKCVNRETDARFPDAGACARAFADLVQPGAPAGKLTVVAPTAVTGHSFSAAMPASALIGSATQQKGATAGVARARVSGSQPVSPAEEAPLVSSATVGVTTGQSLVSTGTPQPAAPRASFPKILLAIPFAVGALVALFFVLRDKPQAGSGVASAGTGTGTSAAPIAGASGSASSSGATVAPGACPMGMIAIPGGGMFMGARDLVAFADAKPPHRVQISAFCLDKTEVTVAAYQACVDKGSCERALDHVSWPNVTDAQKKKYSGFCNAGKADKGTHPINCVAWAMADNYCRQAGERLPTEAEWEYAARGSSQKKYPWGDDPPSAKFLNACGSECAEHWKKAENETRKTMFEESDGHVGTAPVGSFPAGASAHGVLDLAGNVWEWTSDFYEPYAETDANNPPVDPKGPPKGDKRVLRGGDYLGSEPDWSRPSYRWKTDPDTYNHAIGFRCAASAQPAKAP
jgi:formylglycine-generating enzyme required for sulfatase activity